MADYKADADFIEKLKKGGVWRSRPSIGEGQSASLCRSLVRESVCLMGLPAIPPA
jgi:hypothetical protein